MKIEVCLFEQEDVTNFITYLGKLQGTLPIETKLKVVKAKPGDDTSGIHDTITEGVTKAMQISQDSLLLYLRGEGFVCVTAEDLKAASDYEVEDEWQWMVRLLKEAKNPLNNKYDTTLLYGFKLMGPKEDTVICKEFGKARIENIPWKSKDKPYNFKKLNLTKFHPAMVEEERLKFSQELAKYRKIIKDENGLGGFT